MASILFPDYGEGLKAIHSLGKAAEIKLMQLKAADDVYNINLKTLSKKFNEKIQTTSGLVKFYFKIQKNFIDKCYDRNLSNIEKMLDGHEFEKRTMIEFLDIYAEVGNIIPEQIQDKMNHVKSNLDLTDETAWEKSLLDYLKN